VQPELGHEPPGALFADDAGLALLFAILDQAADHLEDGGHLLLEFGQGQDGPLQERASAAGWSEVRVRADLSGTPRILHARR
jgi:methylase of polypeptide subunit release factors